MGEKCIKWKFQCFNWNTTYILVVWLFQPYQIDSRLENQLEELGFETGK
jgi:hypothetical protein